MKETNYLTPKQVQDLINDTIGERLGGIELQLKTIRDVLLGDGMYSKSGVKQQHDEMWRTHTKMVDGNLYQRIEDVVQLYKNIRFIITVLGITSIGGLFMSIISVLKFFEMI